MMKNNVQHIPYELSQLDNYLAERESAYDLKEGAEAKIIWNSESGVEKTDYSVVYLHGFRASHPEGDPVHRKIADSFGYNLYLSRLEEHGIHTQYPLLHLTEKKLVRSARFAFEMGRRIGHKVILMGTSTGGSLALWLASQNEFKEKISSLILYSPLIRFYGIKEKLLTNSLSRKLLHIMPGKKHLIKTKGTTFAEDRIWNKEYAMQGALALGAFVEHNMQDNLFSNVTSPVFIGYYYKNKREHDQVVSVPAIREMTKKLGTRTKFVHSTNFPEAKNHVICSSLLSKAVSNVIQGTTNFLKDVGPQVSSENE
jgi:esterase/lipase